MQIFCDFDGTISNLDTTDYILKRFADPSWEEIEKLWETGAIGSGECMRRQVALIKASGSELRRELDNLEIDQHFIKFINFCEQFALLVTVISDGVDYFIRHILNRHGIKNLSILANQLTVKVGSSFELKTPNSSPLCESAAGVCKCRAVSGFKDFTVYVGDGRSDFCVANKVNLIFAKDNLATYCEQNNIAYIPYINFADVTQHLQQILPGFIPSQSNQQIYAAI